MKHSECNAEKTTWKKTITLIWSSAFGEYFPTEDAEAPDVAEGGILAVVQRFGCSPFDRNLKLKFLLAGGKIELTYLIKPAKELVLCRLTII